MTPSTYDLTQEDVQLLLNDPSGSNRAMTAGKIATGFARGMLDPEEKALATDIFRLMLKDVEVKVREALSAALHACPDIPKDVALGLARDVDSVSLPILEFSSVLTDADLIELVKVAAEEKQKAIARRKTISAELADTIVDYGRSEDVLVTLAGNEGADLSNAGFDRAMKRFPTSNRIADAMTRRPDLSLAITEKLVGLVSEQFRDHLFAKHKLSLALATDLLIEARERATLQLVPIGIEETHLLDMVHEMHQRGRLTPSLVMRSLCMGDLAFFEAAIAELAEISIINARLLIHDQGGLGLKSVYARAGLPEELFPVVHVAVDVIKETRMDGGDHDQERYRQKMIERVLTQCEKLGRDSLDYLIGKLNRLAA